MAWVFVFITAWAGHTTTLKSGARSTLHIFGSCIASSLHIYWRLILRLLRIQEKLRTIFDPLQRWGLSRSDSSVCIWMSQILRWRSWSHCLTNHSVLCLILAHQVWSLIHIWVTKVIRIVMGPQTWNVVALACFSQNCIFVRHQLLKDVLSILCLLGHLLPMSCRSHFISMLQWKIYANHVYHTWDGALLAALLAEADHFLQMWGSCIVNCWLVWLFLLLFYTKASEISLE